MDDSREWQPARLRSIHPKSEGGDYIPFAEEQAMQKVVVFIRPIHPNLSDKKWLRKQLDCPNGNSFFEIRDDFGWGQSVYVCEHECFTD
jgi:hypothetical protein